MEELAQIVGAMMRGGATAEAVEKVILAWVPPKDETAENRRKWQREYHRKRRAMRKPSREVDARA